MFASFNAAATESISIGFISPSISIVGPVTSPQPPKITERNLVANEYERLEFLGDRVLGISIAYLIYKQFPNYNEGKMSLKLSYLVQRNFLFKIANEFELYKYIKISKDKNINLENNKSILADTLEAIIGAIFLDGGFQKATNLIGKIWKKYIIDENLKIHDSKTTLQELSQKKSKKLPIYKLLKIYQGLILLIVNQSIFPTYSV